MASPWVTSSISSWTNDGFAALSSDNSRLDQLENSKDHRHHNNQQPVMLDKYMATEENSVPYGILQGTIQQHAAQYQQSYYTQYQPSNQKLQYTYGPVDGSDPEGYQ